MNGVIAKRHAICLALSFSIALSAAHAQPAEAPAPARQWALELAPEVGNGLRYRGVVNMDAAGMRAGQMLYPAPNLVGFLAAIATHAVINNSVQRSEREALENKANEVLQPYKAVIDTLTPQSLLQEARRQLSSQVGANDRIAAEPSPGVALLQLQPLYWMTQDQKALILDLAVGQKSEAGGAPIKPRAIRMVSAPLTVADASSHWLATDGLAFRATSAELLAGATSYMIGELNGRYASQDLPQRTVRYPEGGTERIERVQVLEQACGRALLRTLRGELLSVPWAAATTCATTAPIDAQVAKPIDGATTPVEPVKVGTSTSAGG